VFEGNILIVAAHPDDEVLGMGGTIHKLTTLGKDVSILFISDGVTSRAELRETIASRRESATRALGVLGCKTVTFSDFPDNKLDTVPMLDICQRIENSVKQLQPTTIFTHFPHDLNIDHQRVSEATNVAARPSVSSSIDELIYFEVLSSTNWKFGAQQFEPNLYLEVEENFEFKLLALSEYATELNAYPNARSIEAIQSLAIYRGATVGNRKSEAFEIGFIRQRFF